MQATKEFEGDSACPLMIQTAPTAPENAFDSACELFATEACRIVVPAYQAASGDRLSGKPILNQHEALRHAVERVEETPAFLSLVRACYAHFHYAGHAPIRSTASEETWCNSVGTALRRGRFYTEIACSFSDSSSKLKDLLVRAFTEENRSSQVLIPLEWISLPNQIYRFNNFSVRTFKKEELDFILDVETAKVFYPWAVWDTTKLRHYNFLVLDVERPSIKVGKLSSKFSIDLSSIFRAKWKSTKWPKDLERAVWPLALIDWRADYWLESHSSTADHQEESPFMFGVPFVIDVDSEPFSCLSPSADCSVLDWHPDDERDHPYFQFCASDEQAQAIITLAQNYDDLLGRLEPEIPEELRLALGFYVKGATSDLRESVLWNMTAVEALLGTNQQGLTQGIAERLEAMGICKEETFRDLYTARCDLVHGNKRLVKKDIWTGEVRQAREVARKAILWHLHFCCEVKGITYEVIPKREDILDILRYRQAIVRRYEAFLKAMPTDFPNVNEWIQGWLHEADL